MKVVIRIEVPDIWRAALRHHYGKSGLATRAEVVGALMALVDADMTEIVWTFREQYQKRAARLDEKARAALAENGGVE